ncbi:MAG TPA: hypothetical protein VIU13_14365 [Chryseolinea sp.]
MTNPAPTEKKETQRTNQQNRALHLYFTLVATALNDAGLDMRTLLKPEIEIPWSGEAVKNYLWRPIMRIQLQKQSTTEMTTRDIDLIYDTLNRHLAKVGISEPFPSLEEIILKQSHGKVTRKK